ncbi:MAG: prepilin-type N-terminal cleavage/methylation domain-containing protein [Candidatus Eisenbacteria bacterium]|uniref:Prepilin-type N-terminal cleavage/methylation domain-containing protein n=1 Tax=Eiseniibacteriota bacterium TaxID=2212470 RepID=A0A948RXG2_UNCEI|nr:prepilin-type N-terminal cleavage/methylation domain-containing protein [Candidatus Eisenbacteria bacterium]
MSSNTDDRTHPAGKERGFSLLEVLIAAVLLIIVFFGLAQLYMRGRNQLDYEEDRRKAIAVAQARIDGIRSDYRYDTLPGLDGNDTTYVVDNRNFTVSHQIFAGVPEAEATTVTLNVSWTARVYGNNVDRTLEVTTMLGRGMP